MSFFVGFSNFLRNGRMESVGDVTGNAWLLADGSYNTSLDDLGWNLILN